MKDHESMAQSIGQQMYGQQGQSQQSSEPGDFRSSKDTTKNSDDVVDVEYDIDDK